MSEDVCLAARMPASFAVCSGSPFATLPLRINFTAVALMVIDPRATASRTVAGLAPTSTIFTRPRASTCDSFLATAVFPLGKVKGEAFERHREVHALQLHVIGDVQRARGEVQNALDAGGDHLVDDGLRVR